MPISAQLSYVSQGSVNPRIARLPASAEQRLRSPTAAGQHTWQTLILLDDFQNGASRNDSVTYARFDAPHKSAPSPWLLAQWSEDFGWHRSLEQIAVNQPPLVAPKVVHDATGTHVELHTQPTRVKSSGDMPHSISRANAAQTTAQVIERAHLSKMLAEAAHDIRSPIAVAQQIITTLAQRVRNLEPLTSTEAGLLDEAQVRLTQANRWAEGILVEQSLTHGQPVNVRRRFYPYQWLPAVQPLLNSLAIQRGVTLAWLGWDRSLPRLYLDANHLARAVLNLASNAIQASRPGSEVRIQVAWQTHVTQRLVITIEDQGNGLSPELMQHINAPEVWSSTATPVSGAGLGLKTAKTLVRALGGAITAQRVPTGGTQFRLTLPVDNYHSLLHSWLQQNSVFSAAAGEGAGQRITMHALRTSATDDAKSMYREIDARLQQAASNSELVYRVAADRWLWLTLQPATAPKAMPPALCDALRGLRERDNAWNRPLDCRQQLVFQWEPTAAAGRQRAASGHAKLMSLTSTLAEKIAELMGDHVPPIDELQAIDAPIVIRQQGGGPARMIRCDRAQATRPITLSPLPAAVMPSLSETPCDTFSGTLAELTQQWHARQQQLEQTTSALHTPPATCGVRP